MTLSLCSSTRLISFSVALFASVVAFAEGDKGDQTAQVQSEQIQTDQGESFSSVPVPKMGHLLPYTADRDTSDWSVEFANKYQLGDEWGKKAVTQDTLASAGPVFQRAARATAKVGGATGFYLGTFNGKHIVATNHHVIPRAPGCQGRKAKFPLLKKKEFGCVTVLGSWSDIDLALFEIAVSSPEDAQMLSEVAGSFDFQNDVRTGQALLTIGFGVASNPFQQMVANQDADCKVFSKDAEYRHMADPDKVNPGTYNAWSFANGCDVSHGDSGSAMVDRLTGKVVGIIWTGRVPKNSQVQTSANLDALLQSQSEIIWEELSYAVPAKKIGEFLSDRVTGGSCGSPDTCDTLRALIAQPAI